MLLFIVIRPDVIINGERTAYLKNIVSTRDYYIFNILIQFLTMNKLSSKIGLDIQLSKTKTLPLQKTVPNIALP